MPARRDYVKHVEAVLRQSGSPISDVLRMQHLALEAKKLGYDLDKQSTDFELLEEDLPYSRQDQLPEITLLSSDSAVKSDADGRLPDIFTARHLQELDRKTLARLELEIQPEELFRDYLTLPDLQQIKVLDSEPPWLTPEWELPSLDFEMVLERDPFARNSGIWREIETSGFEMDCRTSGSFTRDPTELGEKFVFGSITQMPFTPGGMEDTFEDKTKFLNMSPEDMEKGREWARNIRNLPLLPDSVAAEGNAEFLLVDLEKLTVGSSSVNGLNDIMDEKEMNIVKTLRAMGMGNDQETISKLQEPFKKDIHDLLDLAGYGEIKQELDPEHNLKIGSRDQQFVKIAHAVDNKNVKEWAVKVDVATPIHDFKEHVPNMAHKYPFELDIFQKQSVLHLENHESVFVAAHTSAGKTVVAEYAIALSLRAKSRCVYTSPIKALSNQKYRDFKKTFKDVGLLTGDIQIEPNAHCLVMTTEILRSMLYRGSEIVRDLDWVVFDEVHYINDSERGVVWEEILIMLPAQVGIVMLSATVPNAMEFANWIGRIKKRKIYVISTPKRPVPLEHHLYVCVGSKTVDKDFIIVNTKGELQSKSHAEALEIQKEYEKKNITKMGLSSTARISAKQDKTVWLAFVDHIRKKELMPVIAFVFSRNRCDELGDMLSSLDLTSQSEKHRINSFFKGAIARLNSIDQKLPQIKKLEYYLERGVGIHHSGILPIMKEAVEMLFQDGLVKVLFATETFAMGVNMPARTVVFDTITKHDGTEFRGLRPGEYIQMSGRAGRRGLDKTGTVIILCKLARVPDIHKLNQMILGVPTKLESQFRLTYGMILHLLRTTTISIMDMMKRSFSEYSQTSQAPAHQEQLNKLEKRLPESEPTECSTCSRDIDDYYRTFQSCKKTRQRLNSIMLNGDSKLLHPGRVVTIYSEIDEPPSYGVILTSPARQPHSDRHFQVLEFKNLGHANGTSDVKRLTTNEISKALNATVTKLDLDRINSEAERGKISSKKPKSFLEMVEKAAEQVIAAKTAAALSPTKDFNIIELDFTEKWEDLLAMEATLSNFECVKCPEFIKHMKKTKRRLETIDEMSRLRHLLSTDSLRFLPEYQQRVRVLKALGYLTENESITLRGRVACEVSTTEYDLVVAECLFANHFTDREPEEIAALLSGLVFQAKTNMELKLAPSLQEGVNLMKEVAMRVGRAQREAGMKDATGQLADQLNFGLTDVVYHWCMGTSFVEITAMTDVQEGIIVRTMTRLDEVCRDVRAAAKVTGNSRLISKMELAAKSLKRDIAFVGSLYTSD